MTSSDQVMLPPPPPADHNIHAYFYAIQESEPNIVWEPDNRGMNTWMPVRGPRVRRPEDWANIVEAAIRNEWFLTHHKQA